MDRTVPFPRALWFIKCVGSQEMRAIKSGTTPAHHVKVSMEWTKTIMSLILRVLDSISKASNQNHPHQSKEHAIQQRLVKWRYIIGLCVEMLSHGLLFPPEFLNNLLMLFQKSSLKQLPCMIPMISSFLCEFSKSRYVVRQLTLVCQQKLLLIKEQEVSNEFSGRIYELLMGMLKHLLSISPDTFISVKLWNNYKSLRDDTSIVTLNTLLKENHDWKLAEKSVERRNQLLFHSLSHFSKPISSMVEYLYHFRMDSNFDMLISKIADTKLVAGQSNVFLVLDWAVQGYHCAFTKYRVFAAFRILDALFDGIQGLLSEYLFDYLQVQMDKEDLKTTHYIYSAMHSYGIFSFFRYLKKLVATGLLESKTMSPQKQFLLDFGLRKDDMLTLKHQRVTLGIEEPKVDTKSVAVNQLKQQIMEILGKMYANDGKVYGDHSDDAYSAEDVCNLEQFNAIKEGLVDFTIGMKYSISEWLRDSITQYTIAALSSNVGASALNCQQYASVCYIFDLLEDYEMLLQVNIWLVENSNDRWLYYTILSCFRKYRAVFSLLGGDATILQIVWEKYQFFKKEYIDQTSLHFLTKWLYSTSATECEKYSNLVKEEQRKLEVFFVNIETKRV
jgi:hypothetical protein